MDDSKKESKKSKSCEVSCGLKGPGPKYKLKPLVGYDDHCQSKYRNPSYTIGKLPKYKAPCAGPGPKYFHELPKISGYTFPKYVYKPKPICSPAPTYTLPGFSSPAFSITGKPKVKCDPPLSGPYDPPKYPRGPAYTFGSGRPKEKCEINPGIRGVGDVDLIRPKGPAFSIVPRVPTKYPCIGPGPKYFPQILDKAPAYVFGIKHHECELLPKTECDDMC